MSYDLHVVKRTIGASDQAVYDHIADLHERPPTAEEMTEYRRLATELRSRDAGLDVRLKPGDVGIEIGFESRPAAVEMGEGGINIMWSYGNPDPTAALAAVRGYLTVFEHNDYVAFDPQTGELFDPQTAATEYAAVRSVMGHAPGLGGSGALGPLGRWWRRISRRA